MKAIQERFQSLAAFRAGDPWRRALRSRGSLSSFGRMQVICPIARHSAWNGEHMHVHVALVDMRDRGCDLAPFFGKVPLNECNGLLEVLIDKGLRCRVRFVGRGRHGRADHAADKHPLVASGCPASGVTRLWHFSAKPALDLAWPTAAQDDWRSRAGDTSVPFWGQVVDMLPILAVTLDLCHEIGHRGTACARFLGAV
ncbi:hypothetical protein [Rhodovibrio sodomensis]|nr:hypothetical protein [Rhodovibrio sodomensis]